MSLTVCKGSGYILIEPAEGPGLWSITYRHRLPAELRRQSMYSRVQQIAQAEDLERALQTADKWVEKKMGRDVMAS